MTFLNTQDNPGSGKVTQLITEGIIAGLKDNAIAKLLYNDIAKHIRIESKSIEPTELQYIKQDHT